MSIDRPVVVMESEIKRLKAERDHWEREAHDRAYDDVAEIERLQAALRRIVAIEDKMYGPDWEEIEEAREIARGALKFCSDTVATPPGLC